MLFFWIKLGEIMLLVNQIPTLKSIARPRYRTIANHLLKIRRKR